MDRIRDLGRRLATRLRADVGAVATEYSLVLMLIALAIVVAAAVFGVAVSDLFEQAPDAFPS